MATTNVVMFAGSRHCGKAVERSVQQIAAALDPGRHVLHYGGGDAGLMGILPKAFHDRGGRVCAVDWKHFNDKYGIPTWMPPEQVEVHAAFEDRQHGLIAKGDVFLGLPGGIGTMSELLDTLTFNSVKVFHKKVVLFDVDGYFQPFKTMIAEMVQAGYIDDCEILNIHYATTPDEVVALL